METRSQTRVTSSSPTLRTSSAHERSPCTCTSIPIIDDHHHNHRHDDPDPLDPLDHPDRRISYYNEIEPHSTHQDLTRTTKLVYRRRSRRLETPAFLPEQHNTSTSRSLTTSSSSVRHSRRDHLDTLPNKT